MKSYICTIVINIYIENDFSQSWYVTDVLQCIMSEKSQFSYDEHTI